MVDLAVVGAGVMGSNHARVAVGIPDVRLTHVVEADGDRGGALAARVGAEHVATVDDLPAVDLAVVAVPTPLHRPVAEALFSRGAHVLVEKPIAATLDDARAIIEAAERAEKTLAVGHVERFNPAILQLDHLDGEVVHLDIARLSPFSARVPDSVVVDLMIHDLDLARSIVGSEVRDVRAVGRTIRGETTDLASALLEFENGVTASLTASRLGQNKIRQVNITYVDSFVTVDLLRQDLQVNRVEHTEFVSSEGTRWRQQGTVEIPFLEQQGEPLFLELRDVVGSVESGRPPRVTGEDGLQALALAFEIDAAISAG